MSLAKHTPILPIRYVIILIVLFFSSISVSAQTAGSQLKNADSDVRSSINFNRDWKFKLADVSGANENSFDDLKWEKVGIPHSFSIPYFMSSEFYVGYGWYRKHFTAPKGFSQKKVTLEFEGVFQQAEIYVNGQKVGEHQGGYTGFSVDITKALKAGDNMVAVRVNNLWNPQLAPRAGEHVFSGGIYRDVHLVVTNPIHVNWYGTFVQTPVVNKNQAVVLVNTDISNETNKDQTVKLKTDLISPDGKVAASFTSSEVIKSGSFKTIAQPVNKVTSPKLWDTEHPYLYTAVSSVSVSGKLIDQYKTTFGIRTIEWTADKGFFLNGKHLYLRGANVHQDHAGWGDAVTNAGFLRDVQMVKDAGFNFIRGSHYPHDPAFAEACDGLGIILWSENPFWGIGGSDNVPDGYWNTSAYPTNAKDTAAFEASVKQQFRDMVRIFRNHPSIAVWSVSNEPFFTAQHTIPSMRKLLKKLVDISHETDPTRSAAIGGAQRPLGDNRIDRIGDIAGYNGDGGTIDIFQNPGIPNLVSEYGSTTADRPGNYSAGWGDLSAINGKAIYSWRAGQAVWSAFDHGSIAGSTLGKMGIIDYFRIPKRAWYWYRNEYKHIAPPEWPKAGKPAALKLAANKQTATTDGTEDIQLIVTVLDEAGKPLSNSPEVKLEVISGPGEFPTGPSISFNEKSDIRIMDGQAAIEYRSWYAGKSTVRATSPGLKPALLTINFTGKYPYQSSLRVAERPYVRFTSKTNNVKTQTFGHNNPTFASSFAGQHFSGHAADGNLTTWWQPKEDDSSPEWTLDTEKKLSFSEMKITFPEARSYTYKIEVSDDRQHWTVIANTTTNPKNESVKMLKLTGTQGRYIKISFAKATEAALAEVEVTGEVLQ